MNKCSVVFVRASDGWYPLDLVEKTIEDAPKELGVVLAVLWKASKIAEDFDLYCVFSLDVTDTGLQLRQLVTPTASEETQETVEIPATVASAVLVGLSMFLGDNAVPSLQGEYTILDVKNAPEGRTYVKYINDKEVGELRDTSVCVYSYDEECRFVGSYDPVEKVFINKNGEKLEEDESVIRLVGELFDVRSFCEGQVCGEDKA